MLVAGLLRSHFPTGTVEALARDGRRLLLDAQGSLRRAETGPLQRDDEIDRSTFVHLAVLKVNEEEGRVLAGSLETEPLRALGVGEVLLHARLAGRARDRRRHRGRHSTLSDTR